MRTSNPSQFSASLWTSGDDAKVGRRSAQQIRLRRELVRHQLFPLRKTYMYPAGISIRSGFPKNYRLATSDCALLVHKHKLKNDVHLDCALRACLSFVNALLAPIEPGQRLGLVHELI